MYNTGIIIIFGIAAFACFFMSHLAEKTNNPRFLILTFFLPIVIMVFGFGGFNAWANIYTADKVAAAVEKGYAVYVDGREADPAVVQKEAYACEMVDIRDDIREVHVATKPEYNIGNEEDVYEKIFVNGTEVDKSHLSLNLYNKTQMAYDAETKTLYIIIEP